MRITVRSSPAPLLFTVLLLLLPGLPPIVSAVAQGELGDSLVSMDWAAASKVPSWGTTAAAAAADSGPTMLSFAGPSSSSSAAAAQLQDFSFCLVQRARPARRTRAPGSSGGRGGVAEACSVDGCRSDLSRCREYHRRHKVCEAHSKTPVVVVGGQEQRFCQQCSRFHMLAEFDEGKRSCRKRLDGHNRRRRKPRHDAVNFFPYHQVHQQTFSGVANQNADSSMHSPDRQSPFSISFSGTFKAPKHFPFLQDSSSILGTARPALLQPFSSAEYGTTTATTRACSGLSRALDPECALSLLSSSPHPFPADIPSASVPAQFASSIARTATVSQAATAAFASDGAGGDDHVLVPGAMFEDPSQALPFAWQV